MTTLRFILLLMMLLGALFPLHGGALSSFPLRQRLEDDTYAAAVRLLRSGDRSRLLDLIDRNPLAARTALLRLMQEPAGESVDTFALMFPEACDSEFEVSFVQFYSQTPHHQRGELLRRASLITRAEYVITRGLRFTGDWTEAVRAVEQGIEYFHSVGFKLGQAYCIKLLEPVLRAPDHEKRDQLPSKLEQALALYEQIGNTRGQIHTLICIARVKGRTTEALKLALSKAEASDDLIMQITVTFAFSGMLDDQEPMKRCWSVLENHSGLHRIKYLSLTELAFGDTKYLDKFRALLAAEEDPILKVKAHSFLQQYFVYSGSGPGIDEATNLINLLSAFPYDASELEYPAAGAGAEPALPFMLSARSQARKEHLDYSGALQDLLEAIRLCKENSEGSTADEIDSFKGTVLGELADMYRLKGEYPQAIETGLEAIRLLHKYERWQALRFACKTVSDVYSELGRLPSAEETLRLAAAAPTTYYDTSHVFLAQLHFAFSRYEEVLKDLANAEPRPGGLDGWRVERFRLASQTWLRLGDYERALQYAHRIERLPRAFWISEGVVGITLIAMKRYAEAEPYFEYRLTEAVGENRKAQEADALKNLGKISRALGRRAEAVDRLNKALELYRTMGDRRQELEVLLELAWVALDRKDIAAARQNYRNALQMADEMQFPQGISSARHGLAQVETAAGDKPAATEHLRAAVQALESVTGFLRGEFNKTSFLENKIVIYDDLIRLLGPVNPNEAFYYAERRRGRAYLDAAQGFGVSTGSGIVEGVQSPGSELETRLIGKQKALMEQFLKPDKERSYELIGTLRQELKLLRTEHTRWLAAQQLRILDSRERQLSALTAGEVQTHVLKPGQTLVEYLVTDKDLFAFVLTRKSCRFFKLPGTRAVLARRLEQLRAPFESFRAGRLDLLHLKYDLKVAHQIYTQVFAPVERVLYGAKRVIIVADDVLNYLPFEALPRAIPNDGDDKGTRYSGYEQVDWLLRHYTMQYALSASSLQPGIHGPRERPRGLVAFGNPELTSTDKRQMTRAVLRKVSDQDLVPSLPDLPQAATESKAVAQLMRSKGDVQVLLGSEARKASFFRLAPSAEYLHFAVHSLLNEEQPYYSGLLLSPDKDSDGLLQVFEISNTKLGCRLVTLSSCETGLGKVMKGEGVVGLRRAFLVAGAKNVLVSLWSIDDSSSAFMQSFYDNVRQDIALPAALRNAKLHYLKKSMRISGSQRVSLSHPFFWAPFVLTSAGSD